MNENKFGETTGTINSGTGGNTIKDNIEISMIGKEIEDDNKNLAIYLYEHKDRTVLENIQGWLGETYLLVADGYDYAENKWINIRKISDCELE